MTNTAQQLLVLMYKQYLGKLAGGTTETDAMSVGGSSEIHQKIAPALQISEIEQACRELDRLGYVKNVYADDSVYWSSLTPAGIRCMTK